ncbi:hypothetical protein BN439_0586 [Erwinia amylovora Ea644]|uniref:Uncharacterized protein n=3 Tax=Erwinia amylovora TaxID=552 RepID=A0A831A3Y2_ERWAM|nr:hypothetical protein EaACW_2836 [Erwinia amylovora ACW56400]QJQ53494.1 hypothetical protein EHX00_0787 [Erwinia amylovora]CBA22452.1 hypothetical protein predicted by Glimmer/Critica [Erwinia amylovora CFBP1430]CBX81691.1 hypothetical protein predicted by Glimmer/Critica [Erwinia amylovora ATCC BAA-2158]CCO79680.1 hypothetical protein BN432_2901 [Erwinia amylovora Ea356]CCO87242.1 hypothetical protein BN434_2872 [Erwinia amylovora CFBP 2585]CCO91038.1 hypothetical protein BN435_2886 [Erwin
MLKTGPGPGFFTPAVKALFFCKQAAIMRANAQY